VSRRVEKTLGLEPVDAVPKWPMAGIVSLACRAGHSVSDVCREAGLTRSELEAIHPGDKGVVRVLDAVAGLLRNGRVKRLEVK